MAIKECAGCDSPAVGQAKPTEKWSNSKPQLTCAECMKALLADGCKVEFFNPRRDLVARVRNAIASGGYDDATVEGSLAFTLTLDKLIARQRQRENRRRCKWDANQCPLDRCTDRCMLDARFNQLTELPSGD